jgi:hypothetical protein
MKIRLLKNLITFCSHLHKFPSPLPPLGPQQSHCFIVKVTKRDIEQIHLDLALANALELSGQRSSPIEQTVLHPA